MIIFFLEIAYGFFVCITACGLAIFFLKILNEFYKTYVAKQSYKRYLINSKDD